MTALRGRERPGAVAVPVTVILSTLLHLLNISPASVLLCLVMWAYRLLALVRPLPMPGLPLRTAAGAVFFLVAILTNEGLTVEAFVALLALMISLKLFELDRQRDMVISGILCYFVIVSGMFFSDALLTTLYIALALVFNTAVLIHVQQAGMGFARALRLAGRLALQATPFMLILFLLFPRIQGGLWRRPPQIGARTGFSEEIVPGRIASLAQSNDVAFRVTFDGPAPPPELLYWRGIVLWQFDGIGWSRGGHLRSPAPAQPATANPVSYTLTLEPHQRHWLFSLDLPLAAPERGIWLMDDYALYSQRPVTGRIAYRIRSTPAVRPTARDGMAIQALRLPDAGNSRARELARQWRAEGGSDRAIIDKALDYYRKGGFRYTLTPGVAEAGADDREAIDWFLFTSRAGFCEHYAASFAFLMRAAGIPTRLVGGYLGGRLNPYGDHLVVRQSDAHAWCEVLVEGQWLRIDPTAAVAPMRLRLSLAEVLAADGITSALSLLDINRLPGWMQLMANGWDLVDSRWNAWVMNYSFADQTRLFAKLGINLNLDKGKIQVAAITLVLLAAAYFLLLALLRGSAERPDRIAEAWLAFCRALEQVGIPRPPHQGPLDLLDAIKRQRPDLAAQAQPIVELYVALRYRADAGDRTVDDLHRLVRGFSPQHRDG